ncbi:hypothetical protein HIM_02373 [Hirsutella minnesotensis 3608]|nr:hypothetical protein HIM_02373 [Hirsutella minnesotensis 3608]
MATVNRTQLCQSPSPETSPTLAIGAYPDLTRCVSTGSSASNASYSRDSLASDIPSRHSSGSYLSQGSDSSALGGPSPSGSERRSRRRGYMRPQATDFAASARSRESVMSLGSIAHLQYYFARTGLLDGKGAQLARKKKPQRATLDLAVLQGTSASAAKTAISDADSSYASMGSSPDLRDDAGQDRLQTDAMDDDDEFDDSFTDSDPGMLPPTVSTYHQKAPHVPKPPTIEELKADLENTLHNAARALSEARHRKDGMYDEPPCPLQYSNMPDENTQGWYELQGMHILDVVTLAIRAAKMYYTAHELPERLDSIKPEKQVRADLLSVMEVLKQMATRSFKGGLRDDEIDVMNSWIASVFGILTKEEEMEAAERAERANWEWLKGDWTGREFERERSFLTSMDPDGDPLPPWTPLSETGGAPTPFLLGMQNGLRLVRLHNAVVNKSRRRFGAIPTYHIDTQKPYRCADNIRYWAKAAELRFEVLLKVDALGVVYNSSPQVWTEFETAILKWCRHVREEIASEVDC